MNEQVKSDKELADEIEASMNIMWALAPDREAQREQYRVTGKLMVRYVVAIVKALRRAQSPYVQDDEAIALLRKALMTAERPDEAAMGFETDGFLADEIKAFFSRRGISGGQG